MTTTIMFGEPSLTDSYVEIHWHDREIHWNDRYTPYDKEYVPDQDLLTELDDWI